MRNFVLLIVFSFTLVISEQFSLKGFNNNSRIAGGDKVDIEDFPYQLYIHIKKSDSTSVCGGSIISEKWALTAGHCIKKAHASAVTIYAGSTYKSKHVDVHEVSEAIVHPDFDEDTTDFDVAVLKVKTKFDLKNKKTQPITLVDAKDEVADDTKVVVSGWGHTSDTDDKPDHLRATQIKIINRKVCDKQFHHFTKNMICAGTKDGHKNSCSGDSGGPLVTLDGVQVGIVSKGHGCTLPLKPKVYTNVAQLRDWILKETDV